MCSHNSFEECLVSLHFTHYEYLISVYAIYTIFPIDFKSFRCQYLLEQFYMNVLFYHSCRNKYIPGQLVDLKKNPFLF